MDRVRANAALIEEILGSGTLVGDVGWDVCRKALSTLASVPPNRTKIYRDLPLSEAIERAKAAGEPTLSHITQGQYLRTFKELLDLAVNKQLIAKNYASDMQPLRREALAADEKRVPFDDDQLRQFFGSAYYSDCALGKIPFRHADKAWRFWMPLLSVFMGMRPKEIFQLHTADLRRTDKGTCYIDIDATDDDDEAPVQFTKTTKTKASRRQIPLHPELIKIGFVQFVSEQRQTSDDARLFPDITRNKYGDPAHYPLKRFRDTFLKEAIVLRPRQSPYSFRHSWRDATRWAKLSADFLKAVGAWEQGSSSSADNYGSKSLPDVFAEDMAKIAYEGLDLSHLYPKP
jgi:integrase